MKPTKIAFSFLIAVSSICAIYGQKEPTVTFSVYVYDEEGNPLKDVNVTIDQTRQQPNRKTDSKGLIEFSNMEPGSIDIRATKKGYFPELLQTKVMPKSYSQDNWANITLKKVPYADFTILVMDDNNLPVNKAFVKIKQLGAPFDSTGNSGFLKYNLPVGNVDILVIKSGFVKFDSTFTVTADITKNNFIINLVKTKKTELTIYGDLKDKTNNYVQDADINVRVLPFDTSVKSDAFGNFYKSFEFRQINSNEIEIKVAHPDFQKTDKIVRTIQPGQILYKFDILLKKKLT